MILLDMDGVICDFFSAFAQIHGFDIKDYTPGTYNFNLGYKTIKPDYEWYHPLEKDFWSGLNWMHDGRDIVDLLETVFGQQNIVLWTSPTYNEGCIPGKLAWIKKHLPSHYHYNVIFGHRKDIGAGNGNLLIDDSDKNIEAFKSKYGRAILIPRIWNSMHTFSDCVVRYLKGRLNDS